LDFAPGAAIEEVTIEGIERREYFRQVSQATARQKALAATASPKGRYPTGREIIRIAGLKIKAMATKATVSVYLVPLDFCWDSNIEQPPWLSRSPKFNGESDCPT